MYDKSIWPLEVDIWKRRRLGCTNVNTSRWRRQCWIKTLFIFNLSQAQTNSPSLISRDTLHPIQIQAFYQKQKRTNDVTNRPFHRGARPTVVVRYIHYRHPAESTDYLRVPLDGDPRTNPRIPYGGLTWRATTPPSSLWGWTPILHQEWGASHSFCNRQIPVSEPFS